MFLHVKPNSGVKVSNALPDTETAINVNNADQIDFEKDSIFFRYSEYSTELKFNKEAMGEYHKFKRLILGD